MPESYIAKQIIKGGLSYDVLIEPSKWAKLKDEVDVLLIEMGHADLIPGYEAETPDVEGEVVEDTPTILPEV